MTLLEEVVGVCASHVVGAIGGCVFYFVKGTLRTSSLAGGLQAVVDNKPHVRRGAAWAGSLTAICLGVENTLPVGCRVSLPVAWAATNTLFSVDKGDAAAVREGLKGAVYGGAAAIAICKLLRFLDSVESCE